MEGAASTSTENTNGNENQEVQMSSKPLHRFVQREPRSLGIVIVVFGCAELLMGLHLTRESVLTSCVIYIPYWQGLLFLVCGNLSIYTEVHPSKKMVTVCLAMYVVSLFGIVVSVVYRLYCFSHYIFLSYRSSNQLFSIEAILFTSSLCVSALLIFLCAVARLALKSTHTQVIVQHTSAPQSDTTSN
uniref:membrane-spanning 4-domains subfamily A member 4D-like isoform X2 n=1 Tax=Scatophagus argus TaxID=75038 RepID=UPI001ED7D277|nr:membrane-spanning 4-domains subfamily A member 4D-like isoform X2 [Scatophagus argus]